LRKIDEQSRKEERMEEVERLKLEVESLQEQIKILQEIGKTYQSHLELVITKNAVKEYQLLTKKAE
jgi:hypothetical protein